MSRKKAKTCPKCPQAPMQRERERGGEMGRGRERGRESNKRQIYMYM